jgi:hypothetical protein
MSFLTASREKIIITVILGIIAIGSFFAFSYGILDRLNGSGPNMPWLAPVSFVLLVITAPLVVLAMVVFSSVGSQSTVFNSTILSIAVVLNVCYLYALACAIAWARKKLSS